MSTKTVFQRVKSLVQNNEETALQQICKKEDLQPEQLIADHTETMFRWNLIENNSVSNVSDWEVYAKEDFESEEAAIRQAMDDLQTFQGNLKTNHNETEYQFAKIRG